MVRTLIGAATAAAILGLVVANTPTATAQIGDQKTHEGTVVSVTGNKLVMKSQEPGGAAKEHTHTLAPNAKVSVDGKAGILSDLKPGQKVRVTTKKDDPAIAIRIEALDKQRNFEPGGLGGGKGAGGAFLPQAPAQAQKGETHEGKIVSATKDKLVVKGKTDNKEHTIMLAPTGKCTCDGKACLLSDLKPGQIVRVTFMQNNREMATRIEALDKERSFDNLKGGDK
jgi:hypothetical protein